MIKKLDDADGPWRTIGPSGASDTLLVKQALIGQIFIGRQQGLSGRWLVKRQELVAA